MRLISLRSRSLKHKLFVVYALMFILPMMYVVYVIVDILRSYHLAPPDISSLILSQSVGIAAVLMMSIAALLLMYRSIKSIERSTENAETFIQEVNGERFKLVTTQDEGDKILHYITQMTTELRGKITDVDRYALELHEANRKLTQLALKDGLTGLYNQSYIKERLSTELARAQKFRRVLSILMLDIDDFKNYNDTYGHLLGDKALKEIAGVITGNIRCIDIPSRYGGEEFLIILPETDRTEASEIAEGIRRAIEKYPFGTMESEKSTHLTASLGIGVYSGNPVTRDELISAADSHLYQAKGAGKNGVCSRVEEEGSQEGGGD